MGLRGSRSEQNGTTMPSREPNLHFWREEGGARFLSWATQNYVKKPSRLTKQNKSPVHFEEVFGSARELRAAALDLHTAR